MNIPEYKSFIHEIKRSLSKKRKLMNTDYLALTYRISI